MQLLARVVNIFNSIMWTRLYNKGFNLKPKLSYIGSSSANINKE